MSRVSRLAKYIMMALGNPVFDIIETPYVKTDGRVLSGCSVNAALAVGKLGGNAIIVGCVGEDFREYMLQKLREYGVNAYVFPSYESGGFHLRYIDATMNDRTLRIIGRAGRIKLEAIPSDLLGESESILFGPILDELDIDSVVKLARDAKDKFLVVDPQGFIRECRGDDIVRVNNPRIREIIEVTDVFKPNEHEAEVIFGDMNPIKIAKRILKYGASVGIVTLAERGSIVAFDDKVYRILAYRTSARDPTGCGDVYAGALMYYYVRHGNILEAAAFASAAASFMVESTGPDFMINKKELDKRFEWILERVERVE